jgi:hypothetical protein
MSVCDSPAISGGSTAARNARANARPLIAALTHEASAWIQAPRPGGRRRPTATTLPCASANGTSSAGGQRRRQPMQVRAGFPRSFNHARPSAAGGGPASSDSGAALASAAARSISS